MESKKRKLCEPEYKKATQLPGKGAEAAPARSLLLVQLSCPESAENNPDSPKILLYLLCMVEEPHSSLCFMLIVVLHPSEKLWPPFTII